VIGLPTLVSRNETSDWVADSRLPGVAAFRALQTLPLKRSRIKLSIIL
jgi:hypothetical protein